MLKAPAAGSPRHLMIRVPPAVTLFRLLTAKSSTGLGSRAYCSSRPLGLPVGHEHLVQIEERFALGRVALVPLEDQPAAAGDRVAVGSGLVDDGEVAGAKALVLSGQPPSRPPRSPAGTFRLGSSASSAAFTMGTSVAPKSTAW